MKHLKKVMVVTTAIFCAVLVLYNVSPSYAQDKFYSTPDRQGAEGAKESTQIQTLLQEDVARRGETTANAVSITANATDIASNATDIGAIDTKIQGIPFCGNNGMLAGPAHAQADGSGCVASLQVESDGRVTLQAGVIVGTYTTCDSTAAGTLRYNATTKKVEYCNGTVWGGLGGGSGCDFNFPAVTGADVDTFYTSNDAVYSSTTATAQITADTAATIRKNAVDTGLSSGVTINQSNSVGIRGKSSATYNKITGFTLDIGNYTACWQITTKEQDATPDTFTFTALTGQTPSTLVTSNSVTVANFDGPMVVAVTGDGGVQLQVNSGAWGASDNINPGDTLKLRMTTDADYSIAYTATLTLGSASVGWSVTTQPPECRFVGDTCQGGTMINAGGKVIAPSEKWVSEADRNHSIGNWMNWDMIAVCSTYCSNLDVNGYSDWTIASIADLTAACQNNIAPAAKPLDYWISSNGGGCGSGSGHPLTLKADCTTFFDASKCGCGDWGYACAPGRCVCTRQMN